MDSEYENWYHAAHAGAATCAECHLPHQNVVSYYLAKAQTGAHDVYVFSTGQTPQMIRAKAETKKIIQANCVRCHARPSRTSWPARSRSTAIAGTAIAPWPTASAAFRSSHSRTQRFIQPSKENAIP